MYLHTPEMMSIQNIYHMWRWAVRYRSLLVTNTTHSLTYRDSMFTLVRTIDFASQFYPVLKYNREQSRLWTVTILAPLHSGGNRNNWETLPLPFPLPSLPSPPSPYKWALPFPSPSPLPLPPLRSSPLKSS